MDGSKGSQAMAHRNLRRIPDWLTVDLAVLILSAAIIGVVAYIAPYGFAFPLP